MLLLNITTDLKITNNITIDGNMAVAATTTVNSSIPTFELYNFDIVKYIYVRNVFTWLSLVIVIIGIFGNTLSFFVLNNKQMHSTTNLYLANLCVSDLIALIGLLINSVLYEIFFFNKFQRGLCIIYQLYPYVYPIINTFQMSSIVLTVCVSVNQFLTIYFPKPKKTKQMKRIEFRNARFVSLSVYLFSILYCIPYWLKFKYSPDTKAFESTDIGKSELYLKLVHFWLYLPFVYVIPFTILLITNSCLLYALCKIRHRRLRLGSIKFESSTNIRKNSEDIRQFLNHGAFYNGSPCESTKRLYAVKTCTLKNEDDSLRVKQNTNTGSNVTCMLVAVVIIFIICELPSLLIHIFESFKCTPFTYGQSNCIISVYIYYGVFISKFMLILKLSLNFACFCLFSKAFCSHLIDTIWQLRNVNCSY